MVLGILGRYHKMKNSAQGRDESEYGYQASKLMIREHCAMELLPVGAVGITGRGGIGSRVGILRRLGGGAPVPFGLQQVCRFFAVPFWQRRHLDVWFGRSIVVFLCIAAYLYMPSKLNTALLLFSDLGARFLDHIFCLLDCGPRKPFFSHFSHIQGQAHVGLFQPDPTSLPYHSSRHVDNLQDIRCGFKQWDSAITSTIHASVASSNVIKAWFIHSHGCWSGNSSREIWELTTSWCSISQTVQTDTIDDHGGFTLWAATNWSGSSLQTPAVRSTMNWQPVTSIWIHSHLTACCILFVLLPVLWRMIHCASWVVCLLAPLATS